MSSFHAPGLFPFIKGKSSFTKLYAGSTIESIFLTKNGVGDLVVMDLETFARRESMLRLRETLLQAEYDIQNDRVHTVEETAAAMRVAIEEAVDAG